MSSFNPRTLVLPPSRVDAYLRGEARHDTRLVRQEPGSFGRGPRRRHPVVLDEVPAPGGVVDRFDDLSAHSADIGRRALVAHAFGDHPDIPLRALGHELTISGLFDPNAATVSTERVGPLEAALRFANDELRTVPTDLVEDASGPSPG